MYGLHFSVVSRWKGQLLEKGHMVFADINAVSQAVLQNEQEVAKLHQKIAELTGERVF